MEATNESEARKALEKIVKQAVGYKFFDGKLPDSNEEFESKIIDEAPKYALLRDDWMEAIELARAALAASPRNCDRFNTGDVVKDVDDALREIIANGQDKCPRDVVKWLLKSVEEKNHEL